MDQRNRTQKDGSLDDSVVRMLDSRKSRGKKPIIFLAALLIFASCAVTVYGSQIVKRSAAHTFETESAAETKSASETESAAVANPWQEFSTYAEAEDAAGFPFGVPGEIYGLTPRVYRVIPKEIFEVIYGAEGTDEIRLRKSIGTEDNSGDYNTYPIDKSVEISGIRARICADQSGVHVISWNDRSFAYSVTSEYGISETTAVQTAAQVIQGVAAEDQAIRTGGVLQDPDTGERYSDRVILVSVDQEMTDSDMEALCNQYNLSVVYHYDSFNLYALSAERSLSNQELSDLIASVSEEEHVLSVSPDHILDLDSGTDASEVV